jgi:hypothetical protein
MGTLRPSVFPGTAEERDAFLRMDCTCRRGKDGHTVVCGTHALLLDERVVKHLIFYRRCHTLLWPGEAAPPEPPLVGDIGPDLRR